MRKSVQTAAFFLSMLIVGFTALLAQAADSAAAKPGEGNLTDYMMSYVLVMLGIVLGVLVVANTSNRRSRERPAGYVEKNIMAED